MKRACLVLLVIVAGCSDTLPYDPGEPALGPGQLVGNDGPITDGKFPGGDDVLPAARDAALPPGETTLDCDAACRQYCQDADLDNPVNRGLCRSLWGAGLAHRPVDTTEACRRLFVDMVGRFPTADEVGSTCTGRSWGDVVSELMASDEFVTLGRRRAADRYRYDTQTMSVERIFDMDVLESKLLRGHVPVDLYAQVASVHPVVTRRLATPGDMAEEVFRSFLGRPPFAHEKADFARLYALWTPGYYDHALLGMRVPDAYISYRCIDEYGAPDPAASGPCTSLTFGTEEVILPADWRSGGVTYDGRERVMWSGLLTAEEWRVLQAPGRALTKQAAFWERTVDDVLEHYLDYDLGKLVPEVRAELVRYLVEHQGDIRSVHFAVATSAAYLASSQGDTVTAHRWSFGPRKQVQAEAWIDSIARVTGTELSRCDHRVNRPDDFLRASSVAAYRLITGTGWTVGENGRVRLDYANLARPLGGCPENESGSRFRIVSILTTATQLAFVSEVCDPAMEGTERAASVAHLLPSGVSADAVGSAELGRDVFAHQVGAFLGRSPNADELDAAATAGDGCQRALCTAEELARVACFSVLSSSELLFY